MIPLESGFGTVGYKKPLGDLNKRNPMIMIQLRESHLGMLRKDN